MSLIDAIAAERLRVADLGASLTPAETDRPSLCGDWTTKDVLGHLLMPLVTPVPVIVLAMARARFDFDKANVALTTRLAASSVEDLAAGLRAQARNTFKPPGFGHEAPLTDLVVHTQDIARPLGRTVAPSPETVATCLAFVTSPKAARGFTRPRQWTGLRFTATDLAWSHGSGDEVRGTALDLLMALTGRTSALELLDGAGLPAYAARLA